MGVALDPDAYGMGGTGGSFGWWSEAGHVGTHDRGERIENAAREVLGLPPL